jgi:hypothetical protein
MKHPVRFDIFDELMSLPLKDSYDEYSIEVNPHYLYDTTDAGEVKSYERYVAFVKKLEERGGVAEFLHATVRQIADMQTGNGSTLGASGIAGDEMVYREGASKTLRYANRFHKFCQLPAKLATLQEHHGFSSPWEWVLLRFAEGHAYTDISHALGCELGTLTTWLWNTAPQDQLAAAQKARTSHMMDEADRIARDALGADFSVIQQGLEAEQRGKVLSALSGHLKLQAIAHHSAYQPKQSTVSVTPGAISINFALPE